MADSTSEAIPIQTLYNMMEQRFDGIRKAPFSFFPKSTMGTKSCENMNTGTSPSELSEAMSIQTLYNLMEQRFDGIQKILEMNDVKSLLAQEIQSLEMKWDDRVTAIDQKLEIILQHIRSVPSPNANRLSSMAIEATSDNNLNVNAAYRPILTSAPAESTHREKLAWASDHSKSASLENSAPEKAAGTPPAVPPPAVVMSVPASGETYTDSDSDSDSNLAAVHLKDIHFSRCGISRSGARCPSQTSVPVVPESEPDTVPVPVPAPPPPQQQPPPHPDARATASATEGYDSDDSFAERAAAAAEAAAQRLRLSVIAGFVLGTRMQNRDGGGDFEDEARDAWAHLVGPNR
jgi:hypothetical protein